MIVILSVLIWKKEPEFKTLKIFSTEEVKRFRYVTANLDGVPSPNDSALGNTRKKEK